MTLQRLSLLPARLLAALSLALLVACSTIPRAERDAANRALFERHAGAPVDSIRAFNLDRYELLGPDAVALWSSPSRVYLVTVDRPCLGLEQRFSIGVTSSLSTVNARFDAITFVDQPSRMVQRCPIRTIRPVDFAALRAERATAQPGAGGT